MRFYGIIRFAKNTHNCGTIVSRTLGAVYACSWPTTAEDCSQGVFNLKGRPTLSTNRRFLRGYREIWDFLTQTYGARCVYCHKNISTQIDHVIPYSYCKYHGIENLRPCCAWCNLIAGDRVFETFEAKYEFVKRERHGRKDKKTMLACGNCLLPYYSALSQSFIYCPRCHAKEYKKKLPNSDAWYEWLGILKASGISYEAHFFVSDRIREAKMQSVPIASKIDDIVQYMMERGENIDADTLLEISDDQLTRDLSRLLI